MKAYFGLGCFWQPDEQFSRLEGVSSTRAGYAGGTKDKPTYTDLGDHTETVEVSYDPDKISYEDLLAKFWEWHDPTVPQKTQYQSAIFPVDEPQRQAAEASLAGVQEKTSRPVTTRIQGIHRFWEAEDYHQKYLRKCGLADTA